MAKIKDSGNRKEFSSGAVRDIQEGKGRCDLLPLFEVSDLLFNDCLYSCEPNSMASAYDTLGFIELFVEGGNDYHLMMAAYVFMEEAFSDKYTAILEVAVHFEDGAKKYGERNWQKGIPTDRYVDSAVRHYLKWKRGDDDERHDRACLWNLLCGAWTVRNIPELNVYPYKEVQS